MGKADMKKLIEGFPAQLREAMSIGEQVHLSSPSRPIRNIALIGLGGSAFGGEVIRNYIRRTCLSPFTIYRDYEVPAWIGQDTLLIVSSYSGNTEETLSALGQSFEYQPHIVAVSSGGQLVDLSRERGFDAIQLPGGYPPRTAAGFSIVQQLYILNGLDLIPDFREDLNEAVELLEAFEAHDEAALIAQHLKEKAGILYSGPDFESAAIRWRQQLEENAKHIAFHHVIPEMNHNELVGWKNPEGILDNSTVILLRSDMDHPRIARRMDLTTEIVSEHAGQVIELQPQGKGHLAQLFWFIHFGDWVSYYLAELNGEDPMPVQVIDYLKNELGKTKV